LRLNKPIRKANPHLALLYQVTVYLIFSFGMAFSRSFRCVVFLAIPQTLTGRGRYVLIVYIGYLIVEGPLITIMANSEQLTSSLLCSTKITYLSSKQLMDKWTAPIRSVVKTAQNLSRYVLHTLSVIMMIVKSLKAVWSVISIVIGSHCLTL
jgi:hypothetical protein